MADAELLEEAINDFWKLVDERFPKSFVEKFVSEVKAAAWNYDTDPQYEVLKKLMKVLLEKEKLASNPDRKVWSPVGEAIEAMWEAFATQENKNLKEFCELLQDDRFPEGFISEFITLLGNQKSKWTIEEECKKAKALMTSHFKKYKEKIGKKRRKKEQKNREHLAAEKKLAAQAAEDTKLIAEQLAAEKWIPPVLTEEEIEENRANMRKRIQEQQTILGLEYFRQQRVKRQAFKEYKDAKARADQEDQLLNGFANCRPFEKLYEAPGRNYMETHIQRHDIAKEETSICKDLD